MPRRLPPLNGLKAFEATARLMNFSKAAQELFVTPSAVSQQVKSLENFLGIKLIKLVQGRLELTPAGEQYLPVLRDIFDRLETTTTTISRSPIQSIVSVTMLPTFAIRWLIPRLKSFHELYPTIDVRLICTVRVVDLEREDVDIAIRFGSGNWPGLSSSYLMGEEVFPVCAPELANGPVPLRKPSDLARHTLLHVETPPRQDDWRLWLESVGAADEVDFRTGHRFDSSSIALRAATFRLGVAMAHRPFVEDDLRLGKLIAPFDHKLRVDGAYYVAYVDRKDRRAKVEAFTNWLLDAVEVDRQDRFQLPGD